MLAADGPAELPGSLPGAPAFERVVAAAQFFRAALVGLAGIDQVEVLANPAEVRLGGVTTLVAGPQAYVEAVLRSALGMPVESARFVILPGSAATVQLLPDRAVLGSLNAGRSLG